MMEMKNILNLKNKVIAFDIDGVVTDNHFIGELIKRKYTTFDYNTEMTQYFMQDSLFEHGYIDRLDDKDAEKHFENILDELLLKAPLTKGFLQFYNHLIKQNRVIFITARDYHFFDKTVEYFNTHNIKVDNQNIFHTSGSENKQEILLQENVDIFFEDKLDTLENFTEKTDKIGFLINTPYNQKENPYNIIRIQDFTEFM